MRDQQAFQRILEAAMGDTYSWGFSSYLEHRDTLLATVHRWWKKSASSTWAWTSSCRSVPLCTRPWMRWWRHAITRAGEGNYGGWVLLKHDSSYSNRFYSLYGHLRRDRLPAIGKTVAAGTAFAQIGDFHENGNWFHHTHIQVITQKGLDQGYLSKGYCTIADLGQINDLCPSPIPLFIR